MSHLKIKSFAKMAEACDARAAQVQSEGDRKLLLRLRDQYRDWAAAGKKPQTSKRKEPAHA